MPVRAPGFPRSVVGSRSRRLGALCSAAVVVVATVVAVDGTRPEVGRLRSAVPVIDVEACDSTRQGTGVVVEHNGVARLLTDAHVVDGATSVSADGAQVTVLGAVIGRDAAVVAAPDPLDALPTGPLPAPGEAVVVAAHPAGRYVERRGTVVAHTRRAARGGAADVALLDVAVEGGSSGGAVLDDDGRVVAIVAARDPRSGGAVAYPVDDVLDGRLAPGAPSC